MEKSNVDFRSLPDAPGVYRFIGSKREILYVGKATSLRSRVKSYFANDIAEVRSPLIAKIVNDAVRVEVEGTNSVLEALILEAKLIKKYQPIGNTGQKDNKSWSYLAVTNEKFPRVLVVRERELSAKFNVKGTENRKRETVKELFGPFPSAGTLREALKIIRRIFPFFDTSFSLNVNTGHQNIRHPMPDILLTKAQEKKIAFNRSIGLYPQEFDEKEYKKTIRAIIDIFSARKATLVKRLEKEMHGAAKRYEFEKAGELKRKIFALEHIRDITLIRDELREPETAAFRIEAYDIAHLRGAAPRGVMAVVENGEPRLKEYRTFIIRSWQEQKILHVRRRTSHMLDVRHQASGGDDYAALDEMITRRAKHREWPYPRLIVIDGGRGHLNRAKKTLKDAGMNTAEIVSVVKDEKHRPREILGSPKTVFIHEAAILLANSEAHRFAIGSHRRALSQEFRR